MGHYVVETRQAGAWCRVGEVRRRRSRWTNGNGHKYPSKKAAVAALMEETAADYVSDEELEREVDERNATALTAIDKWPLGAPFHRGQVVRHTRLGYRGPVTDCKRTGRTWFIHISVGKSTSVGGKPNEFTKEVS